jgi:alkylation response protein AidB-like acyl-CoA dehydrogenase
MLADLAHRDAATRAELLRNVQSILPLLRQNAERTERERRIPAETLAAMEQNGLFRILVPRRYSGHEASLRTYTDVVAEISRGCGATGWVAFISDATDWLVAQYPEDVVAEVYGPSPDTRIIGIFDDANARTRKADGGFVLSGQWPFGSGSHHAHWVALGAPLSDRPGDAGLMLVPTGKLAIKDTWHVAGMKGTGSDTVVADEVFVPERHVFPWGAAFSNQHRQHGSGTYYGASFMPTLIHMLIAPLLGLAQAALDVTIERLNRGKKISYTAYGDSRQAVITQMQVAEAATLTNAAFVLMRHWADRIDAAALAREDFDYPVRAQIRNDVGYAVRLCRNAAHRLLDAQGASAFADANPLQRIWRDLETASRHAILNPDVAQEIYGKALLGVEERITPLV